MPQDILLDMTDLANVDLAIADGDFVIGESTIQHQFALITSRKGDWKENPLVGVDASLYLKDEDERNLLAEAKSQFEKDGMQINSIQFNNGNFTVDAAYTT